MATSPARPGWLTEHDWPYPVRRIAARTGPVAVTDAGEGPVLLLVHVGFWSFLWRDLLALLTSSFRCVAVDAPGTGLSHRPANGLKLETAADAVEAVIEQLELDDLTLVLHDLGGPAGLAAATRRPGSVRAIAAINTFGWRPSGPLFRGMLALVGSAAVREIDALTGFLPGMTATRFGVGRNLDRRARRVFRLGMDRVARRSFHEYMSDARRADRLFERVEDALDGPLSDRPLLTVFGERSDPLGFQSRWQELFPGLRQEVVPGGHHFPMCDAPRLVADALTTWHDDEIDARPAG